MGGLGKRAEVGSGHIGDNLLIGIALGFYAFVVVPAAGSQRARLALGDLTRAEEPTVLTFFIEIKDGCGSNGDWIFSLLCHM